MTRSACARLDTAPAAVPAPSRSRRVPAHLRRNAQLQWNPQKEKGAKRKTATTTRQALPEEIPGRGTETRRTASLRSDPLAGPGRSRSSVSGVHVPDLGVHVRRNAHFGTSTGVIPTLATPGPAGRRVTPRAEHRARFARACRSAGTPAAMAPPAHFFERASEAQPSRQRRPPGKAPGTGGRTGRGRSLAWPPCDVVPYRW